MVTPIRCGDYLLTKPLTKIYDITLEASKTGLADGSDWPTNTIPLDYPASAVSGIFINADGSGTNYWTTYSGSYFSDNWIYLSATADAAMAVDTAFYVTYKTGGTYETVAGVMLTGTAKCAQVIIPVVLSQITAQSATGTDYEISGLTTGQTLAAEIRLVPPLTGVVITQIEATSDGTNYAIGIYEGAATTGTVLNIKFSKSAINGQYNSSTEFPSLRVVIEDDAIRLGIVDTGADATPASTQITVRGYPLI